LDGLVQGRGVDVCKHLEVLGVTDLLAGVDVDEDCHCWSLLGFGRAQCRDRAEASREVSNSFCSSAKWIALRPVYRQDSQIGRKLIQG